MLFRPKHGVAGWPGPQCRRLETWCAKWQVENILHVAESGTHYYTLFSSDGAEITVRVSDHAEAWRGRWSPDYTIDPYCDQWPAVRQWIETHGRRPRRWGPRIAARYAERIRALLADLPDVSVWTVGLVDDLIHVARGGYVLASMDRRGLWYALRCPAEVRQRLQPLAHLNEECSNDGDA